MAAGQQRYLWCGISHSSSSGGGAPQGARRLIYAGLTPEPEAALAGSLIENKTLPVTSQSSGAVVTGGEAFSGNFF